MPRAEGRIPASLPALAALALALAGCGGGGGGGGGSPAAPSGGTATPSPSARAKPNIVYVVADDLDSASVDFMPKLQGLLAGAGTTFSNSFAADPVCCPSRATLLRGQYAHNHGIWTNGRGSNTCFEVFQRSGQESSTVATWLKSAGYRTGLVGKYLNLYPGGGPTADNTYVPPGWDDWYAVFSSQGSDAYYDYYINENRQIVSYGSRSAEYLTDVLTGKAVDFIKKAAGQGPFFLHVSPSAPHSPATPAARHEYSQADKRAPRPPSFNEADLNDKPRWYRENLPVLGSNDIAEVDGLYKRRLETMAAVDDMIEKIVQTLESVGQLQNTYIVFTSDNGFLLGQHRFPTGKDAPYEESIRVPLLVRGPGVPAGRALAHDVSNIDLGPTFAELAGAAAPDFVDGRSLASLLSASPPALDGWRKDLLIEHEPATSDGLPSWFALRTKDWIYVDYPAQSEEEYYDLVNDPYQLDSRHRGLDSARRQQLRARLAQLQGCRGASCRSNPQ